MSSIAYTAGASRALEKLGMSTYRHDPESREILRVEDGESTPIASTADIQPGRNWGIGGGVLGAVPGYMAGMALGKKPWTAAAGTLAGAGLGSGLGYMAGKSREPQQIANRMFIEAYNDTPESP